MTVITKTIGRLPVNLGEYDSTRSYGRKNRVLQYTCELESKVDNNTYAPFTWDGAETFTLDDVHWTLISGNPMNYILQQAKPATTGTTGDYPYNGMGRVVLAKNMVNVAAEGEPEELVNTLTQDMFYKGEVGSRVPNTNTIFVIQYDFVLGDANHESQIIIPDNCILKFEGGSLSDGTLQINDSSFIIDAPVCEKIFSNIRFSQGCPKILHTSWWGISSGIESDNDFEYLLNSITAIDGDKRRSILYIDNNIVLSRSIEATARFAEIAGYTDGGVYKELSSMVTISSSIVPSEDNQSLIKINVWETNIHGINFEWLPSGETSTTGDSTILELLPAHIYNNGDKYDMDATVTNCGFNSGTFACHHIKATGRGFTVESCGFSMGNDTATYKEGIIKCITKKQLGADNDYGSSNADNVRRIRIRNNSFHTGRLYYALVLSQGSDNADAEFRGVEFVGNHLDRGTKLIYCTAKNHGVMVSDNILLFPNCDDGYGLCVFYGTSVDGLIFTNNLISGSANDLANDTYYRAVLPVSIIAPSDGGIIKNILIANNSIFRGKFRYGLLAVDSLGDNNSYKLSCVNISNNVVTGVKAFVDSSNRVRSNRIIDIANKLSEAECIVISGNALEKVTDAEFVGILLQTSVPSDAMFEHIRIESDVYIDPDAYTRKGELIDSATLNPHLTDTTHWIDVKTD